MTITKGEGSDEMVYFRGGHTEIHVAGQNYQSEKIYLNKLELDGYFREFFDELLMEKYKISEHQCINERQSSLEIVIKRTYREHFNGLINKLAQSLLSDIENLRAPTGSHPDYLSGKASMILKTLREIDKTFGTKYAKKIKAKTAIC